VFSKAANRRHETQRYLKIKEQPLSHHLLVTPDRSKFTQLCLALEARGGTISWADSGHQALTILSQTDVDLVVADETLSDMPGLDLIKRMIALNPMINCAAVSSLSQAAFHEASEGLGLLMQLPPSPDEAEGERLMANLNQVLQLTPTKRQGTSR
jgi:DNA-binding NtrC family response regulator